MSLAVIENPCVFENLFCGSVGTLEDYIIHLVGVYDVFLYEINFSFQFVENAFKPLELLQSLLSPDGVLFPVLVCIG